LMGNLTSSPKLDTSFTTPLPLLFCQDYVMQYWMEHGAPAEKLLLGFPTHSRSFTLSTTITDLGAPFSGPATPGPYTQQIGIWSYYETCSFLKGTSVQWIDSQKVPYAVKGNQWVGFDNQRSYDAKVEYLKSRQLGGAAVWTLDMDDFSGQFCEQGKYPLISHLKHALIILQMCAEGDIHHKMPHPGNRSQQRGANYTIKEFCCSQLCDSHSIPSVMFVE
uniref:Oviductal glycoprotein 1 n=1 Tax=Lates calcarifer TaxID=8187 RepID=A0A4W6EAC9_LATCA